MKYVALTFATALGLSTGAWDGGEHTTERLGVYASILGRAAACNIDTQRDAERVAQWIDRVSAGDRDRSVRMILFAMGLEQHAESQRSGYSIETCTEIRDRYQALDLP